MSLIDLDVWADVVCPWCYIGKHRLEQAIAGSQHPAEVTVRYHAFQLDPGVPVGGDVSTLEHLAASHGGDLDSARRTTEQVTAAARPDGIGMDFEHQLRANSFDAHRLVALGLAQGGPALQAAVLERLFSAYFAEGKAIDDRQALQRLGAEAGLDERRLASVLASDEFGDQVRADERMAREIGIDGVPFVMGNGRVAVTGAQSVETFGKLIDAALAEAAEAPSKPGAAGLSPSAGPSGDGPAAAG